MSFIKLFAEQELADVDKLRGSYRGQLDEDFVHLVFSDENFYVVKPTEFSGDAYEIMRSIPIYEIMRSIPMKDFGVKKLEDKKLQLLIDGEKHQFSSVMKADLILQSVNEIRKG